MIMPKTISRPLWLSSKTPQVNVTLEASASFGPPDFECSTLIMMPSQVEDWSEHYGESSGEHLWELLWTRGLSAGVHEAISEVRYPIMSGPSLTIVLRIPDLRVDLDGLSRAEIEGLSRKFAILARDLVDDLLSEAMDQGLFVAYDPRELAIEPKRLDDSVALERIYKLDPEQMSFEEYVRQIRAIIAETGVPSMVAAYNLSADDMMPAP